MIVRPDTASAAISAAPEGATLQLVGVFPTLPLKRRKPNLTLDCTQAEVLSHVRVGSEASPVDGLHIQGGLFRAGLMFAAGRNVSVIGARFEGDETRAFNGIGASGIVGLAIRDNVFRDCLNGVVVGQAVDFEIEGNDFERIRKDVIHLFACRRGVVRKNACRDHRPLNIGKPNADHPDAIQMLNAPGKPPTSDILLELNDFEIAHGQGITQTHKPEKGDPRFSRITYRKNTIRAGQPYGLGMIAVDGGVIEDNTVETLPGSPYISRIIVSEDCTDIVFVGRNTHAAYLDKVAIDWPATVKPDPRDAEIVRLTEALAAANGRLDAVRAALS